MQAVILAAGRGTRMGVLTETRPKPMLEVSGKTLLEHKFDVLPSAVDEIVIVVGYLKEVIQEAYGDSYAGRRIRYVEQANIVDGTADALWMAKDILHDRFFVMMGDDIYALADIDALLKHEWALLAARVSDVSVGGSLLVTNGALEDIIEHSKTGPGLVSTNLFMLDTRVFAQAPVPKAPGSTELGLPQTVLAASRAMNIPLSIVEATRWIQISGPGDLTSAAALLSTAER
jgi:bifunctional UDP-N-acetylglucosamine pyrophosphorylase/glucosamine-1-phosphate N-acetyltransferase